MFEYNNSWIASRVLVSSTRMNNYGFPRPNVLLLGETQAFQTQDWFTPMTLVYTKTQWRKFELRIVVAVSAVITMNNPVVSFVQPSRNAADVTCVRAERIGDERKI